MFSRIALLAWEAREAALIHRGLPLEPYPGLVAFMHRHTPPKPPTSDGTDVQSSPMDINIDDFIMNLLPMPVDYTAQPMPYDAAMSNSVVWNGSAYS